jgi:hypothetical protein
MKLTTPLASVMLVATAASLSAQIIYTQDFEGGTPPGWFSTGGYSANVVSNAGNFGNTSAVAYLDVERWGSEPTNGASATIVGNTSVAYTASTAYSFTADLAKTSNPAVQSIDVTFEIFAGDPTAGGLLLGSFTSTGTNVGSVSFSTLANAGGSGNLFLRIGAPALASLTFPTSYRQAQIDNISISAAAIPEPSSFAVLGGAAALLFSALRRRRA